MDKAIQERYEHLRKAYGEHSDYVQGFRACMQIVEANSADSVEVKHGKWCLVEYEYLVCDKCGNWHYTGCESTAEAKARIQNGEVPNYCSNCGAKMDGERSEK